jgi:hypothetical protein
MARPFRLNAIVVPLIALVAVLAPTCGTADAQVKPFKISGEGVAISGLPFPGEDPRTHTVVGTATHLGKHRGAGSIKTDSVSFDPSIGALGGFIGEFGSGSPFIFTGANGDKLFCNYGRADLKPAAPTPGVFVLTIVDMTEEGFLIVEAFFIAEFVALPKKSTGKFKGATGSWDMYAYTEPFILGSDFPTAYWWEGEGKLNFKKPAGKK